MRGYKTLIQEAELIAMPPEAVADFLKRRAEPAQGGGARDDAVDEEVERSLYGRRDPLIDLALARYGFYINIVADIFQSADSSSPIRLACLTNKSLNHSIFLSFPLSFPVGLWGRNPGPMIEWLLSATDDELCALFENPKLDAGFLSYLLTRSKEWATIPDDRLLLIVLILHRNPRMRTPRESEFMDGIAEYSYNEVFGAAWELAETVPPTDIWAAALGRLYMQLPPYGSSIRDPLAASNRWHVDPTDAEAVKKEAENLAGGSLSDRQRVRQGLARLALFQFWKRGGLLRDLLASDDVAFRCAAYSAGSLSAEQLRAAYEKDGELAYYEALNNLALWQDRDTRQALHDIALNIAKRKKSYLLAINMYRAMEKGLREEKPTFFYDEKDEEEINPKLLPATKADITMLTEKIESRTDSTFEALLTILRRTRWIWWFSLGALATSLWHF